MQTAKDGIRIDEESHLVQGRLLCSATGNVLVGGFCNCPLGGPIIKEVEERGRELRGTVAVFQQHKPRSERRSPRPWSVPPSPRAVPVLQ